MTNNETTLSPQIPAEFATPAEYLAHLAWVGIRAKYTGVTFEIGGRLEQELRAINDAGFADRVLLFREIMLGAREAGIACECSLLSVPFLTLYAIDMSRVDPINFGFGFEPFFDELFHRERETVTFYIDAYEMKNMRIYAEEKYGDYSEYCDGSPVLRHLWIRRKKFPPPDSKEIFDEEWPMSMYMLIRMCGTKPRPERREYQIVYLKKWLGLED